MQYFVKVSVPIACYAFLLAPNAYTSKCKRNFMINNSILHQEQDGGVFRRSLRSRANDVILHRREAKTVITFGTFDLFHVGHVNILERASRLGDRLVVGVSSDAMNYSKKGRYPVVCQEDRMRILKSLSCVDEVFLEESMELKGRYIRDHQAEVLVMGDDWAGRFDHFSELCEVVYLTRTPSISTTDIRIKVGEMP